ncbi:MAG: biotin/lipoyl-containing protein, partial [Alphaproteobacteria bacterium]
VAVLVERGQKVEAGDPLVMVEAMKVEAVVPAPRCAVVDEILVQTGDSVESGDLLVVFDENA